MKIKNSNKPDNDDTPWYGRLILGIVLILFIIFTFFYYIYITDQLAGLVSFASAIMFPCF